MNVQILMKIIFFETKKNKIYQQSGHQSTGFAKFGIRAVVCEMCEDSIITLVYVIGLFYQRVEIKVVCYNFSTLKWETDLGRRYILLIAH